MKSSKGERGEARGTYERVEERDKKRSGLVVTNTSRLSGSCERGRIRRAAVAAVAAVSALLREGGSEGKQAVGRRGSSEMHFVD